MTLHTTLVASWALLETFDVRRPVREPPKVPFTAVTACIDLARQLWTQGRPARAEAALVHALTLAWPDRASTNEAARLLWQHDQMASGRARLEARLGP